MWSVNPSIERSCGFLRTNNQVWLLQFYLPNLTVSGRNNIQSGLEHHFSHFSRKALNNLTGRLQNALRHCPVLADAIAPQLVRNGKCEVVDGRLSRLVFQEVSNTEPSEYL